MTLMLTALLRPVQSSHPKFAPCLIPKKKSQAMFIYATIFSTMDPLRNKVKTCYFIIETLENKTTSLCSHSGSKQQHWCPCNVPIAQMKNQRLTLTHKHIHIKTLNLKGGGEGCKMFTGNTICFLSSSNICRVS